MRSGFCAVVRAVRRWSSVALVAFTPVVTVAAAAPDEWPRVFVRDRVTNTLHQPQLESWDGDTLKASAAVVVQSRDDAQPILGAIQFEAYTRVDRAEREVFLETLEITQGEFPAAGEKSETILARLRALLPKEVQSLSLDRLEANLAILEASQPARGQPLKNDPPVIRFSNQRAMLVPVDGPPVYRPVPETDLERVFNTRVLLLRERSGKHYLHLFDGYVEAADLAGPWTVTPTVPRAVKQAERTAVAAKSVDLLVGQEDPQTQRKPSLRREPVPALHVVTVPTELIVTTGQPRWTPLPPTQLTYVSNTTGRVFRHLGDQQTYVLVSGRWFRGPGTEGPWEYVPGARLPKDFGEIPDDSPMENAKAAVPGTRQAGEAVIASRIPSTVKVDRQKARLDPAPAYDGSPQLVPVEGTGLSYVANCATPVLRAEDSNWYACQNGVWFEAPAANGPWVAATRVPAEIYALPPSVPVYYVVYARIHRYDDAFIWAATTPGYYGAYVNDEGVVVYGTGYVYPPYLGSTLYVAYPVTYGYGSNPCWTPWVGWCFGFAAGWALADDWDWWCYCPPAPYWGPYWYSCYGAYYNAYGGITAWGPYGWAGTSGYIYHQHGPWSGVSRAAAGYDAWSGNQWATSYGRAYNSTTGTRVAGQRAAVENIYTGNQVTAGRAIAYNPQTGQAARVSGVRGESGGAINVNGHIIAGRDGNYYRPDGQGGWEQITRPAGGATPRANAPGAPRPGPGAPAQWNRMQPSAANQPQMRALYQQQAARQWGAQRQRTYQVHRPSFRGGGIRRR